MTDWKAVAMAAARLKARVFTDFAELAFDSRTPWRDIPRLLGERLEQAQFVMLDDWRAAGVTKPLTLYGMLTCAGAAFWVAGLSAAPRLTLKFTGTAGALGTLYGTANVLMRRNTAAIAARQDVEANPFRTAR